MLPDTTIQSVMTTEVYFVKPNETMAKVDDMFRMHAMHHLPVLDDQGKVVGILSREDLSKLKETYPLFTKNKEEEANQFVLERVLVKEVMSKQLSILRPDDSIYLAFAIFRQNLIHAIPVVGEGKRLVGILTPFDLLDYAFQEKLPLQSGSVKIKKDL